jgi:hypothetical protein
MYLAYGSISIAHTIRHYEGKSYRMFVEWLADRSALPKVISTVVTYYTFYNVAEIYRQD